MPPSPVTSDALPSGRWHLCSSIVHPSGSSTSSYTRTSMRYLG